MSTKKKGGKVDVLIQLRISSEDLTQAMQEILEDEIKNRDSLTRQALRERMRDIVMKTVNQSLAGVILGVSNVTQVSQEVKQ